MTAKLSQYTFISKSAQEAGPEAASAMVIFIQPIFANSFLSLSVISIDVSFLPYSFFIRFIVIEA